MRLERGYHACVAPVLSVIIPTHRRPRILRRCIEHLDAQTARDSIEVIVIGDGHDEETAALFAGSPWKIPVTFLEVPKCQQGSARNAGVKRARGERVLFIGDDIFLEPGGCEKHCKRRPGAVLGFTTWDPASGITPVMRWLEESGWQFGYPMLEPYRDTEIPRHLQHRFTYTSQISLPRSVATAHPFRDDVSMYGWEDIEWGMRLRDAGVALVYEPAARALHHHHIEEEDSLCRMETLGKSAMILRDKVPGFDRVPTGLKLLGYRIPSLLPTMAGKHRKAFLRGLES